ncbi:MAG TPA: response regulator [Phycisphaeraceae bacterium]|nr:response regulator [Phycisphaeraceae bacterium]
MQDGKHVILYVDDDVDLRDSLRLLLEANGYKMVDASTAEQGLEVYKKEHPDFIIVDLMMEEVDAGTLFAKELKALGNTAPVYMLSSVGKDLGRTIEPTELGLDGVFQKPIDKDSLLETLKQKLG